MQRKNLHERQLVWWSAGLTWIEALLVEALLVEARTRDADPRNRPGPGNLLPVTPLATIYQGNFNLRK